MRSLKSESVFGTAGMCSVLSADCLFSRNSNLFSSKESADSQSPNYSAMRSVHRTDGIFRILNVFADAALTQFMWKLN